MPSRTIKRWRGTTIFSGVFGRTCAPSPNFQIRSGATTPKFKFLKNTLPLPSSECLVTSPIGWWESKVSLVGDVDACIVDFWVWNTPTAGPAIAATAKVDEILPTDRPTGSGGERSSGALTESTSAPPCEVNYYCYYYYYYRTKISLHHEQTKNKLHRKLAQCVKAVEQPCKVLKLFN